MRHSYEAFASQENSRGHERYAFCYIYIYNCNPKPNIFLYIYIHVHVYIYIYTHETLLVHRDRRIQDPGYWSVTKRIEGPYGKLDSPTVINGCW